MLAGLLFATQDAEDRPNLLTATLPFGGATLIEFQARLLIAAGAAQILIAVARATPELLGAVNRIKRRGVPVDMVRTAAEALEKTHPLASLLVLADGLVTTDAIVAAMARGEGDALLVIDEAHAVPGLERIDADTMWAGIARIGPRRLADAARLPEEYDLQSTLLRIAAQGRPQHILLDSAATREGHGIERDSRALAQRGRRALGARLATRRPWIDRFVLGPLARRLLPPLVERRGPTIVPAIAGGVFALAGFVTILMRWPAAGLLFALLGVLGFSLAQGLCWLRGDDRPARWFDIAIQASVVAATLLLGGTVSHDAGTGSGWLAAAGLIVAGALVERAAAPATRPSWWGSPPAYLVLLALASLAGEPLAGLIVAAGYAAVSLADAIEKLRRKA
jgi:hypothetical protein